MQRQGYEYALLEFPNIENLSGPQIMSSLKPLAEQEGWKVVGVGWPKLGCVLLERPLPTILLPTKN